MILYQRMLNGVCLNQWTSDFADANYTEPWWGPASIAAISAAAASYSGIPAGATTAVTLMANTAGSAGNVSLSIDGTSSLTTLVTNWNAANPNNQITLMGDGTQVPNAGLIALSDGVDAVAAVPIYTITQTDITIQYNQQQAVEKAIQNQSMGATIIANVAALNESKLASGAMTQATFTILLADQNVLNIERLLWNGSLVTAKALIQAANLSAYYTSDEVSSILVLFP